MAYPGEYRREQVYGEDGYIEGGEYNARGYGSEAGYGVPYGSEGYVARPYEEERGFEHHKHGHHHQPEVVYVQPGVSDLGTGLSGGLRGEGYGGGYSEGYGSGYGRNQPGYAAPAAYGRGGYENAGQVERLEEELQVERRRAREAEAAAAAATAYALHERRERKEDDEDLERFEYGGERKHKHHFFD